MATKIVTTDNLEPTDFYCDGTNIGIRDAAVLAALDSNSDGTIDSAFLPPVTLDVHVASGVYNAATEAIDLTLTDSSVVSIPASDLVDIYALQVTDGATVNLTLTGDGSTANPWNITAEVVASTSVADNVVTIEADGIAVDPQDVSDWIEAQTLDCGGLPAA